MKAKVREHESGLVWAKSSYSSEEGGECVEVAVRPHVVRVRDSKGIARRGVAVDAAAWTAFLTLVTR
ncbi:DUF397 domain-containing protein [Streptomyces europaeiscabiei]|uniref:DUF397 domain-containing protein n=1 Tax=Streptomyces europaeiscabiei TaxID=146819 RepID=UPI00099E42B0|nr:DUF397 domain-containing protein [Streptomyces europaeiscabiei]MDX3666350.1 DUF397 domain-containing protein [Streptomyces europaeiscabiei]MDX3840786.1 DUF397 domain-containing protein [Streptomyces europaeiscabiei]